MPRPTDDELRALLGNIDHAAEMMASTKRDALVYSIVEELLERRKSDRNADGVAAEMRRWNGEE